MASKYWLKLYHEMLDDPKVMTLPKVVRWRFIEALLVAGELDKDGALPSVQDYAWRVRDSADVVETEFVQLADAGLLSQNEAVWSVTKFAERQAAVSPAERMRRHRERQQKQEYYEQETEELPPSDEDVTLRNADIDKIRIDKDKTPSAKTAEPPPAKKPRKPKPKTNQNKLRKWAEDYFREKTNLEPIPGSTQRIKNQNAARWWTPLRTICEMGEWKQPNIQAIFDECFKILEPSMIFAPQSLINTASKAKANLTRPASIDKHQEVYS